MADDFDGCIKLCGAVIKMAMNDYTDNLVKQKKLNYKLSLLDPIRKKNEIETLKSEIKSVFHSGESLRKFFIGKQSTFKIFGGLADLQGDYFVRLCEDDSTKLFNEWLKKEKKKEART